LSDMTKKLDTASSLVIRVVRNEVAQNVCIRFEQQNGDPVLISNFGNAQQSKRTYSMFEVRRVVVEALNGRLDQYSLEFSLVKDSFVSSDGVQAMSDSPFSITSVSYQTGVNCGASTSSRTMSHLSSVSSQHSASSLSEVSNPSSNLVAAPEPTLPKNLTIAVLDDSLLVRKSISHMIKHHLKASPQSFTTGGEPTEALLFPTEIGSKQVDIAIFDENLDYANQVIKGTSLAVLAREQGFAKCLILHSANADLINNLHPVFNGFVEKTSSKEIFLNGVQHAWDAFVLSSATRG